VHRLHAVVTGTSIPVWGLSLLFPHNLLILVSKFILLLWQGLWLLTMRLGSLDRENAPALCLLELLTPVILLLVSVSYLSWTTTSGGNEKESGANLGLFSRSNDETVASEESESSIEEVERLLV
jgi:hypothetical protein